MKTKRYLRRPDQVVALWDAYNQGLYPKAIAKDFGVSYGQVNRWVSDIQSALAGERVVRKRCADALEGALRVIRSRSKPQELTATQPKTEEVSIEQENPGAKVERLWNQLQEALGELSLYMAEQKTREIIEKANRLEEEAKKSNILGFIQKRWEGR